MRSLRPLWALPPGLHLLHAVQSIRSRGTLVRQRLCRAPLGAQWAKFDLFAHFSLRGRASLGRREAWGSPLGLGMGLPSLHGGPSLRHGGCVKITSCFAVIMPLYSPSPHYVPFLFLHCVPFSLSCVSCCILLCPSSGPMAVHINILILISAGSMCRTSRPMARAIF